MLEQIDLMLNAESQPSKTRSAFRQCRPKCRPINLPGRQFFADLNSAKVRIFLVLIAVKKSAIIEFDTLWRKV